MPFAAAGITATLLLVTTGDSNICIPSPLYLIAIPVILVTGIVFSLKSIARIEMMGDKDYAYSGLVLNLLFLIFYLAYLIVSFYTSTGPQG